MQSESHQYRPGSGSRGEPLSERAFDTVPRLFWHAVRVRGDAVMMRQKDFGVWRAYGWREVGEIVADVAAGLAALGLRPGEVVSVLSNTQREWVWTDLGAQSAGAVVSGIYPTDAPAQVEYLCADSGTAFLFVENEEQLDKYLEVRARLPRVRKVVVYDMEGLAALDDPAILAFDALLAQGRALRAAQPGLVEERLGAAGPDDVAVLVYTSGTTGRPKGAMLSHRNILRSCLTLRDFLPAAPLGERMCFLPLCHVAERIFGEYHAILLGAVMNFAESPDTVFDNLREIQPDVFMAVPRVWEKLYSSVVIALREATPLQRRAYALALRAGQARAACIEAGRALPARTRAAAWLADALVLGNVRCMMGLDRTRMAVTGAAPISPDLIRWFMALGIVVHELWGMTEITGAATCNPPGRMRPGSIGVALPHTEVRVSEEGELLVRGPQVFLGYLNLPEKTAETIVDGWLRTGDVGRVDEQGYFYITDRMKDLIITAGGKNVTPSEWENQLKFSPYVTDAVVIGDRRPFLTCLVMIDHDNVERWAQEHGVQFSDYRSLCRSAEVVGLIAQEVARVNGQFARVEQIKAFRLIETRLSAEDEELTPTMKLKRKLVNQKYGEMIESMYEAKVA
ncbi:AMP-dependent synthetase/ligase [Cupriavidus malaysiensis]|uniref:Long-chain fatty acid--CoA ligase n=1 Tax=Cupriavidus malaysiensis TaxID=367825 RepID=A0ABM6F2R4_9BURK|nr:long-chain fatty acid--CoA ligase [Cupriavidus malaysiensis]AOZ05695.1 long-chain fatty acid--CoA ligase [Cupriavidus malaysiensis]